MIRYNLISGLVCKVLALQNAEVTMKPRFIVDDMDDECGDDGFEDGDDGFETVCAICDDGGDLTW